MSKKECVLDCDCSVHKIANSPNTVVGADAYCRFHGYRTIITVHDQEWRVLCLHCTYGRWCGQQETAADRVARKHKHECFTVYDKVTASGGTPRAQLIKKHLREKDGTATIDTYEQPPF